MPGIELCLLDGSLLKFKVNTQDPGPSEPPGFGTDSERIAPRGAHVLGAPFAWRHRKCFLLTSAFCPSPPHAACPVSWRYWSLPRPVGRRRTLGDLYAISWRQGVYLGVSFPVGCLGPGPRVRMHICALPACACCMRDTEPVRAVRVVACRFGWREPGL